MPIEFIKAHAYRNDFLFIEESLVQADRTADLARAVCNRHSGIGADGLIFYRRTTSGAAMKLFNADGTVAEVSGNGVRCLAAIVVGDAPPDPAAIEDVPETVIETDGGIKTLTLLSAAPPRYTFRAFMGEPQQLEQRQLEIDGEQVEVVVLSVGNPQCIVLTDRLDETRFRRLGPALATHTAFPAGTNVEFVHVERPRPGANPDLGARRRADHRLWHRGVCLGRGGRSLRRGRTGRSRSSHPAARKRSSG